MSSYVRSSNPIWSMVDLQGNQLDDTYYLHVLQNTIPYLPAAVYQDENGTARSNPVQFLANGTLPIDLYFDPSVTYRLEVRQGNSQSDPLIYLIENYDPNGADSGGSDIDTVSLTTDNQITNPQFSQVSFVGEYSVSSGTAIEIAPGWYFTASGSGTATFKQVAFSSSAQVPTNAPYVLQVTLSGSWSNPYLYQRFDEAGTLWSNQSVSNNVTLRTASGSNVNVSADLYDSAGNLLTTVLSSRLVTAEFNSESGTGTIGDSSNTQIPPNAYIEYRFNLPETCDLYLTSFQLVAGNVQVNNAYEQDTIERQIDHLFHYYRNSIIMQPKNSLLTGFNWGLNPWQFTSTSHGALSTNKYMADQVIVIQQNYVANGTNDNVSIARAGFANNYGFQVTAAKSLNQFALLEWMAPETIRPYWNGSRFSLMVKLNATLQNMTNHRVKARLIYRAGLPNKLAKNDPINAWTAGSDPTLAAGYTFITPQNDPEYNLSSGDNTLLFENFPGLPVSSNANMTLGVLIYTIDNLDETGTADKIIFNSASLVPNRFALEATPITYEQNLQQCQFYYETSFVFGLALPVASTTNICNVQQNATDAGGVENLHFSAFQINFETRKNRTPTVTLYDGRVVTANRVHMVLLDGTTAHTSTANKSNWSQSVDTQKATYQNGNGTRANTATFGTASNTLTGRAEYHYIADARLAI